LAITFKAADSFLNSLKTRAIASGLTPLSQRRTTVARVSMSKPVLRILDISINTEILKVDIKLNYQYIHKQKEHWRFIFLAVNTPNWSCHWALSQASIQIIWGTNRVIGIDGKFCFMWDHVLHYRCPRRKNLLIYQGLKVQSNSFKLMLMVLKFATHPAEQTEQLVLRLSNAVHHRPFS